MLFIHINSKIKGLAIRKLKKNHRLLLNSTGNKPFDFTTKRQCILLACLLNSQSMAEAPYTAACFLCEGKDGQLMSYSTWNDDCKEFIKRHLLEDGSEVPMSNPTSIQVCKKHYLEAKRHHKDPSYVPKWQ